MEDHAKCMKKETTNAQPFRGVPALQERLQHTLDPLRRDEQITLALRCLYESYGYRQFRMNRFEPYDFYAAHRDFLANGQIVSFTDLDGTLMALRPDVTLSIVKRADFTENTERLYYTEPVYRPARGLKGYQESFQIGVEYLGEVSQHSVVEVIMLAIQSLSLISSEYVLELSHTGFLRGLLSSLSLTGEQQAQVQTYLAAKNAHELNRSLIGVLPEDMRELLQAVAHLSGPLHEALPKARQLARGTEMLGAVDALETLQRTLEKLEIQASALHLDTAIAGDTKYYDGIILRGYISGVPGAVLSGGQYDPLLRRMDRPDISGIGFALYFDELAHFLSEAPCDAVDTLVLYSQDADPASVMQALQAAVDQGERAMASTTLPKDRNYARIVEVQRDA